jgi:hypothetical protein
VRPRLVLLGEDGGDPLDELDPGGPGRGEVELVAGMLGEPVLSQRRDRAIDTTRNSD